MILDVPDVGVAEFHCNVREADRRWIKVKAPGRIVVDGLLDNDSGHDLIRAASQDVPGLLNSGRVGQLENKSIWIGRNTEYKIGLIRPVLRMRRWEHHSCYC